MKYRDDIKWFIKNNSTFLMSEFPAHIAEKPNLVYEVLKVYKSKALFVSEHLSRLEKSIEIQKLPTFSCQSIFEQIEKIIEINNIFEGNLKITIDYCNEKAIPYLYFIPHRYPNLNQIENGVKILLQFDTRNRPQAKISNWKIREKANSIIDNKNVYETILVNENDEITEGSRSNIFFIKQNTLYTAENEKVLLGITREKVIEIAKKSKIPITYKSINYKDIDQYEACFITGTSPGVLQVWSINDKPFAIGHSIFENLRCNYEEML